MNITAQHFTDETYLGRIRLSDPDLDNSESGFRFTWQIEWL